MTYYEIRFAWNAQADDEKQWNSLTEAEKIEWAARLGAAKERAARQAAQTEVADLKERIARAGVDHRRALHEALQQEREAAKPQADGLVALNSLTRYTVGRRGNGPMHTFAHPDGPFLRYAEVEAAMATQTRNKKGIEK